MFLNVVSVIDAAFIAEDLLQRADSLCNRSLFCFDQNFTCAALCGDLTGLIALNYHFNYCIRYTVCAESATADFACRVQARYTSHHVLIDIDTANTVLAAKTNLYTAMFLNVVSVIDDALPMIISMGIKAFKVLHNRIKHTVNFLVRKTVEIEIKTVVLRAAAFVEDFAIVVHVQNFGHFAHRFHLTNLFGNVN